MKKLLLLSFLSLLCFNSKAQEKNIEKVIFNFNYFKYPDTEYSIDYKSNKLTCLMKYRMGQSRDTILQNKTYSFTNEEFEKLKEVLNQNIPDSIIRKSESAFDGGGFTINYLKKAGDTSKIIIRNPYRNSLKYTDEFKKVDAFFDFAYKVVKDSLGIEALDNSIMPYFSGLPIRKVSDNPLEYKIWGSISGDASEKNNLVVPFINSLPKDQCVILDCNEQLSYAWQEDILRLYVIKNSNIKFVNNDYLKHIREHLFEIRKRIKKAKNNEDELKKLERISTYKLYYSDEKGMDEWLKLPKELIFTTVNEVRRNCR